MATGDLHRGGRHQWENLVSACRGCNHRKGGKTVEEAKMALRRPPFEPRATPQYLFQQYLEINEGWRKFIGIVAERHTTAVSS